MLEMLLTKEFWMWYFILGTFTMGVAAFRTLMNKQMAPPNEMSAISYFVIWWIWLPILVIRWIYYKVKHNENI